MSKIYETRLREEFKLIRKLQIHPSVKTYLEINYFDRTTQAVRSINQDPLYGERYPEKYKILYKMAVYAGRGRLMKNWQGSFEFTVSESIIMNMKSGNKPYAIFNPGKVSPFNNHISGSNICDGNAWHVGHQYGLWYYIIAIGMLINQDEFVTATNGGHFNRDAFNYWVERGKRPVTRINWPMNLDQLMDIKPPEKKGFTILTIEKKKSFVIT